MKQRVNFFKNQIFFIFLTCLISSSFSNAQYKIDYKKSADNYYAKADYYSAAVYYEKYLEIKSATSLAIEPYFISNRSSNKKTINTNKKNEIIYRLADCYRSLNNYLQAEKWYKEALKYPSNKFPEASFYFGITLRANGKYAEAQIQFEKYLSSGQKLNANQAKLEIINNQFSLDQINRSDISLYQIDKVGSLNPSGANYAAFWNGSALYFTSTRSDSSKLVNGNPYLNAIYRESQNKSGLNATLKLNIPVSKDMEQGVACFTASGKRAYLTRWIKKEGKTIAAIYTSELNSGVWSDPIKLNNQINVIGFSAQQPFITSDGKFLIFSSNRPGGQGKFDLWYGKIDENGNIDSAKNLGTNINTEADEQAPYYHEPTGTLVFSSNGRVGLGGFDFFKSKGILTESWQTPENMGYPINSSKDDLYFANKGNADLLSYAFISSDRSSECCLELFSVNKIIIKEPKIAEIKPSEIQVKPIIEQLAYFDFDKYVLKEETKRTLEQLASILKKEQALALEITGYTNRLGTEAYNIELSKQRANACKEYLISLGIDENKLNTIGKGKCCITGDDLKDMRVEFRLMLLK